MDGDSATDPATEPATHPATEPATEPATGGSVPIVLPDGVRRRLVELAATVLG